MSWLPRRQVVFGEFSHSFTCLAVSAASVTPVRKSSKKSPNQKETVVRLALDDLVRSPKFVMDIGEDQPAHCGRGHWVTATYPRSLLSACWPWCQRRTRSRHTPRRLLRWPMRTAAA